MGRLERRPGSTLDDDMCLSKNANSFGVDKKLAAEQPLSTSCPLQIPLKYRSERRGEGRYG
jgi:hypothetical protein